MQRQVIRTSLVVAILCGIKVIQASPATNRDALCSEARKHIGSTAWAWSVPRSPLSSGDPKCNLFVAEMIRDLGLSVPNRHWWTFSPIGAAEWGDPNSSYLTDDECWEFCDHKYAIEGDVLSDSVHMGIVTGYETTTSAAQFFVLENDWGFRPDERSPTACWRYAC